MYLIIRRARQRKQLEIIKRKKITKYKSKKREHNVLHSHIQAINHE